MLVKFISQVFGESFSCSNYGALAQLARALRWQRRGQRFESAMLHHSVFENCDRQRLPCYY